MQSLVNLPRRARLFVDREVQSSILIHFAVYGVACTTYFTFMLICTQYAQAPERPFWDVLKKCGEDLIYWLPGLLILAPLAVNDLLKTTARAVGPLVRLQAEMKLLLRCQSERPIRFRDGDHWPELAITYNQLRGELLLLRRQVAEYEAAALGVPLETQKGSLENGSVLPPQPAPRPESRDADQAEPVEAVPLNA